MYLVIGHQGSFSRNLFLFSPQPDTRCAAQMCSMESRITSGLPTVAAAARIAAPWTGEASLVYVGWLGSLQLLRACAIQYHGLNSANGDTENTQWLPSDCSRFAVVCLCWCTTRTNFTGIGSTGVVPKPRPPIPVLRLDPAGPFSAALPCGRWLHRLQLAQPRLHDRVGLTNKCRRY